MTQTTYTQEEQIEITNNYNKVVLKAQDNEHSLSDMRAIVAYNQMQLVLNGKPRWVAAVVKEAPPKKVRVTCGKCGEVKSKCPYKTKERTADCLVIASKQASSAGTGQLSMADALIQEVLDNLNC